MDRGSREARSCRSLSLLVETTLLHEVTRKILLLVIALIIAAAFTPMSDRLIIFPTTYSIDAHGAQRQFVSFENERLEIWTALSPEAQSKGSFDIAILRFYGNADRADRWVAAEASMFPGHALKVFGVNYPGFGGSTGPARLNRLGPAALAAYDQIKREAPHARVIVFGASLGTTAALHVAVEREVGGLILHNPPALRQIVLQQHGWWNLWLLAGPIAWRLPSDLDSVRNAARCREPAVFLLSDAYAGPKKIVPLPGADHNTPLSAQTMTKLRHGFDWLLAQDRAAH